MAALVALGEVVRPFLVVARARRVRFPLYEGGLRTRVETAAGASGHRGRSRDRWRAGNLGFISPNVAIRILLTAQFRNHLWFDGITYHGAHDVEVRATISSAASW